MRYQAEQFESVAEDAARLLSDVDLLALIVRDGNIKGDAKLKAFELVSDLKFVAMELLTLKSKIENALVA
jgi:hypothetical protein